MFPSNNLMIFRTVLLGFVFGLSGCLNSRAITPIEASKEPSTHQVTAIVPTKEIIYTPTIVKNIQPSSTPFEENPILGRISYIAYDDATPGIGILGQDGKRNTVVDNCLFCRSLSWSPDGKWIAFEATFDVQDTVQIYMANVDTFELKRVTTGNKHKFQTSWSSDGTQIVYVEEGETTDLVIVNVVSGESRKITYTRGFESNPSWSPDGKKIAFIYSDERYTDAYELRLMDTSGDNQYTIADSSIGYGRLSWSQDNKELLFVSNSSCSKLEKINLETGVRTQYNEIVGCVIDSSWSLGKNLILFIASESVSSELDSNTWQMYTMTPSGDRIFKITNFDDWGPLSAVFEPVK